MTQPDDTRAGRPFAAFVRDIDNGHAHEQLTEALADLVHKVTETGRKGTLNLALSVSPLDSTASQLVVTYAVTAKPPRPEAAKTLFFSDTDGNLTRRDPNQLELGDIRALPEPPEIKEARA